MNSGLLEESKANSLVTVEPRENSASLVRYEQCIWYT